MRCPICKDLELDIISEIKILPPTESKRTYFNKCKGCGKTFVRHTEFMISGIISCDILLLLEDNKTTLFKELYRK